MIIYTLAQLRNGTGFARGAKFVHAEDVAALRAALQTTTHDLAALACTCGNRSQRVEHKPDCCAAVLTADAQRLLAETIDLTADTKDLSQ